MAEELETQPVKKELESKPLAVCGQSLRLKLILAKEFEAVYEFLVQLLSLS